MEASGASSSRSSQPPPDTVCETPTSTPRAEDLADVGEGESASAIRGRVMSGIKHLNRERDLLIKFRVELKDMRKRRAAMPSNERCAMDGEIQLAKLRVENQAAVVRMLEGQDGPFKEKFINDRRFGRVMNVMEEGASCSDQLPPQYEANATPSQGSSGGMLRIIQMMESPARMERLVFGGEDIPANVPDRVKPCKIRISDKAVFVPFGTPCANETLQGELVLQSDISGEELQVPAEPVDSSADRGAQAIAGPSCTAQAECSSMVQQQENSGTALVAGPSCTAQEECGSMLQQQGSGGTALVAEPACAASAEHSSVVQQQDTNGTALRETLSLEDSMDIVGANNVADKSSANVVSGPASSAVGAVSVWDFGAGAPTFAQVVSSAPGSVTRPGRQVQGVSASRQAVPPQATTTTRASRPNMAPFPSGSQRRNVVLLKWGGSDTSPARRKVVDLILAMGFGARDLYALIHVDGTRDYTVSFTRPEGLDLFWERFEARCRSSPEWEGLVPVAVSVLSTIKKVTIILMNESVPAKDLEVWLRHYGDILSAPTKILDDRDIWTGGWSATIRLARDGNVVRHLPSSAFIGRDRMTVFYPGQPKLCHRCGEKGHYSMGCSALICTMCRGRGHVAKDCTEIRCNLCHCLGHPYSQCPEAWHNLERELTEEFDRFQHMDIFSSQPPSPVIDPPGPVQVPSPAATPSVSVSLPPVSIPVSPQPSVPAPLVSVPSVPQESVSPRVSSPSISVPSNTLEDLPSLQEEVCVVGVVEGTKEGATASSDRRAPAKSRAKAKNVKGEVTLSEDDLQYLEGRKGVRRRKKQKAQVVQESGDAVPVSNRFSVLSDSSALEASSENGESEMECEGASRKREASGDEQQRGAKKPSI